jgi:uncharacterized membrane protein
MTNEKTEETEKTEKTASKHSVSRYLLTGILTVIPIWITWMVFNFLFTQLSRIGMPIVRKVAETFRDSAPTLVEWILAPNSWFLPTIGLIVTLLALYLLGWIATLFIGKRLICLFDTIMEKVPLVKTIYGSTKKLLSVLQQQPDGARRVVLIDFPSSQMKTVGFVTQILTDDDTGKKLAAVYVPTTPNPTSGYLEIVPLENIVSTSWTMDEAMAFIISGGTAAPSNLNYTKSVTELEKADI